MSSTFTEQSEVAVKLETCISAAASSKVVRSNGSYVFRVFLSSSSEVCRLCHGRFVPGPFKFVLHRSVYHFMWSSARVFYATNATFDCFLLIERFLSVFPSNCTMSPAEISCTKPITLTDKFQGFVPATDSKLHVFLVIAGCYSDYFYLKPHSALNVRSFRGSGCPFRTT
jgi:hypothetical protein